MQSFRYLIELRERGVLTLPDGSRELSSFGRERQSVSSARLSPAARSSERASAGRKPASARLASTSISELNRDHARRCRNSGPRFARSAPDNDQFVVLHGVEWKTYRALRELFDGPGGGRTTRRTGRGVGDHEPIASARGYKTCIARLIESLRSSAVFRSLEYGPRPSRMRSRSVASSPTSVTFSDASLLDDDYRRSPSRS